MGIWRNIILYATTTGVWGQREGEISVQVEEELVWIKVISKEVVLTGLWQNMVIVDVILTTVFISGDEMMTTILSCYCM